MAGICLNEVCQTSKEMHSKVNFLLLCTSFWAVAKKYTAGYLQAHTYTHTCLQMFDSSVLYFDANTGRLS